MKKRNRRGQIAFMASAMVLTLGVSASLLTISSSVQTTSQNTGKKGAYGATSMNMATVAAGMNTNTKTGTTS